MVYYSVVTKVPALGEIDQERLKEYEELGIPASYVYDDQFGNNASGMALIIPDWWMKEKGYMLKDERPSCVCGHGIYAGSVTEKLSNEFWQDAHRKTPFAKYIPGNRERRNGKSAFNPRLGCRADTDYIFHKRRNRGRCSALRSLNDLGVIEYSTPVFSLGEIMIMNPMNDRTIPDGRKPSKWHIETEDFDNIEDAIKRANEVIGRESS